jgi:hypothetical protein
MGEAKRRKAAGRDRHEKYPTVVIADNPGEHRHVSGSITIHVLHGNGASLSSTPLDDVEEAIDVGRQRRTLRLEIAR